MFRGDIRGFGRVLSEIVECLAGGRAAFCILAAGAGDELPLALPDGYSPVISEYRDGVQVDEVE